MRVLGIDPGYAIIGYGAILQKNMEMYSIGYGAIETSADWDFGRRLEYIYDNTSTMINKCRPDAIAIEKLYFNSNQKTVINVAQARGTILLAAQKSKVSVFEYTPLEVKSAVTGYGRAKKLQVMQMTKRLLKLESMPKLDDTCDALAIAICHVHTVSSNMKYKLLHTEMRK